MEDRLILQILRPLELQECRWSKPDFRKKKKTNLKKHFSAFQQFFAFCKFVYEFWKKQDLKTLWQKFKSRSEKRFQNPKSGSEDPKP